MPRYVPAYVLKLAEFETRCAQACGIDAGKAAIAACEVLGAQPSTFYRWRRGNIDLPAPVVRLIDVLSAFDDEKLRAEIERCRELRQAQRVEP